MSHFLDLQINNGSGFFPPGIVRASSLFPILSAILLLLAGLCVGVGKLYSSKTNIILSAGILFVAAGEYQPSRLLLYHSSFTLTHTQFILTHSTPYPSTFILHTHSSPRITHPAPSHWHTLLLHTYSWLSYTPLTLIHIPVTTHTLWIIPVDTLTAHFWLLYSLIHSPFSHTKCFIYTHTHYSQTHEIIFLQNHRQCYWFNIKHACINMLSIRHMLIHNLSYVRTHTELPFINPHLGHMLNPHQC